MTNTATLSLTNAHGLFIVDPDKMAIVIQRYATIGDDNLRILAAGRCGHPGTDQDLLYTFRDCTRIEVLIMLLESGNY